MTQVRKVVFITGGLGGIGLSFGENFLQHGAQVALVDLRDGTEIEQELKKKYGEDEVIALKCDITDIEQLRASYQTAVKTFGGLDIVINSAGIMDEVNYERTIAVMLTAVITSSYMAVERMRKDKGGRGGTLINIASINALVSNPFILAYSAAKGGLLSFGKSLVANLGDNAATGIKVGTICPSKIITSLQDFDTNPVFREDDITQPNAKESVASFSNIAVNMEGSSTERLSDALMKYLAEPNLHGSIIVVDAESVHYVYPENLSGQKLQVDQS